MQVQGRDEGTEPVLYVIDHFRNPHAGTEGQLFQLVKGLDRSRFSPYLLVFSDSDYLREQGFPCDYEVLGHSRLSSPSTWLALWKFARHFKARGGRLAHVFFNDPSVICPPVFRSQGIKTIISRRDMGYWYTPAWRTALSFTGRFVSAVITNSQAVSAVTAKNEFLALKRIHVVYNGFEAGSATVEMPTDLFELRAQNPEAVFAGLAANIRPIKRIQDAIEALGGKHNLPDHLHLLIIGDGDTTELKKQAVRLKVDERVHFLGGRSDVKACLKALDIGLLCSESEGFSNSIIEYMQAGLPIVCSDVGGNPEAVVHGETGYLYPCGDVASLAAYLAKLAGCEELRRAIGDKAGEVARQRFGMERMISQHERIYHRVVGVEG
ncbi:glycosyltransferase [Marinobacter sp. TBZ242]|uniref:Glycosyltransferase n=1 Tax=Marinobacter azerbaijanicus TaxID=3050455 RepID=A0ABT7I6R5_9GAMM|nr:glycosyltransferase [Marinobacter sp. TBZ242]MDL0429710.1 glycosyltransferase [Marinobacter sp. TBZ242]